VRINATSECGNIAKRQYDCAPLSIIIPPVTAIGGSYAATFEDVASDTSRKPCSAKKSQMISLAFGPRESL